MQISNMFNIGSWLTIMKSVVAQSADSGLEPADSSAVSNANPAKDAQQN